MFTPVLVIVAAAACRAVLRRDAETYRAVAAFFALVAAAFTISLGEATAVWLGWREGRLPVVGLVFVGGVWVYAVLMAVGHWYLYRESRAAAARSMARSTGRG
jgi:hypothetical protein